MSDWESIAYSMQEKVKMMEARIARLEDELKQSEFNYDEVYKDYRQCALDLDVAINYLADERLWKQIDSIRSK